jgi:hypothetical protein
MSMKFVPYNKSDLSAAAKYQENRVNWERKRNETDLADMPF